MTGLSPSERKAYTREVQAVFQDPYGAFNPRMRVGSIISEPMEVHGFKRSERQQCVMEAITSASCTWAGWSKWANPKT